MSHKKTESMESSKSTDAKWGWFFRIAETEFRQHLHIQYSECMAEKVCSCDF